MLKKFFAPGAESFCTHFALLGLRVWLGTTMLANHGFAKLTNFGEMSAKFPGLFGLGSAPSLALAVFAEFFCSLLLVVGLLTRLAALNLAVTMAVAFFIAHKGSLTGEHSGELAFIYLAGFVTLLVAGPGRFSTDGGLFKKREKPAN